jgi:hypothetical protein
MMHLIDYRQSITSLRMFQRTVGLVFEHLRHMSGLAEISFWWQLGQSNRKKFLDYLKVVLMTRNPVTSKNCFSVMLQLTSSETLIAYFWTVFYWYL